MEDIKTLTQEEIDEALESLEGWEQKENKITKEFKFPDFMDAVNFVYQLAPSFERIGHHADIHIFYDKILFELETYDAGGKITNKDIETAKEIEEQIKEWK